MSLENVVSLAVSALIVFFSLIEPRVSPLESGDPIFILFIFTFASAVISTACAMMLDFRYAVIIIPVFLLNYMVGALTVGLSGAEGILQGTYMDVFLLALTVRLAFGLYAVGVSQKEREYLGEG